MTRSIAAFGSVLVFVLACGGGGGRPSNIAPPPPTTSGNTSSTATTTVTGPVNSDPTVLTDAMKARDKQLAPKIEAILDAYSNFEPRVSPDGKHVIFRSNRAGVPELFISEAGKPSSEAKKIVAGPERVASADWSRDGKWIIFRRDQGADENFRLFRVKPEGGDITTLTPGETMHRDDPVLPRKKAGTIFFSSRKTSSPETYINALPIEGGEPKVVFTDPGPSWAVASNPDGTHVLVFRFVSPTNQILFDLDVAAGKTKRVYPLEGKSAGITHCDYSIDGKRIFVATDGGGEDNVLVTLDATSFIETARYVQDRPKSARVAGLAVSPKGDRVAISIDAGNRSEVRVLNAQTLKHERDVRVPLGATSLADFTEDGKRFAVTQSLPDAPPDIYLVDPNDGKLEKLRDDKRPGLESLPGLDVNVATIPAHDGLQIPVHTYLPKGRDPSKSMPVIVNFHGGPASSSRIGWNWTARMFTSQGFAFVEPNIRGSTGFGRAYEMADNREKRIDALKDVETVNKWLRTQLWADPDRLVIYGGSYGGYIVLMGLTRQTALWRAGVDIVGVANLFTFLKSTDQTIRSAFVEEFGDLEKDAKLLEEFSPMRDKDKIAAPLFVYQGQNDPRVPRPESDQVVVSLRSRNVPVEYMVAPNEGHSLDRRENRLEFGTRVIRFLGDHLK
jgi:dipeptidyl aminopeptidase/acylaminoacyl peptidase